MVRAIKSVSIFVVFFIYFLLISELPEIEAQDDKCLKEYIGGDIILLCNSPTYPSMCYRLCRWNKGALGGKCLWDEKPIRCLCDYCSDNPGCLGSGLNDRYKF
ncbi:hypothetical protein AALP_AA2G164300 [Arabis alpina]|uniref:Knottin scorpion toxin-like domain-containing protein n=1 Tax=Arabis alpina TaxID=50452 RepID=A0A087HHW6_ARAAL|nr:hypothetical protein AALP_AA2G164300 [Arabis alpina]